MNIIKIYLNKNASGSVAELYKDFALFVNSYQNKLIDVYVPKSMLYSNEDITFINAVKIGALLTAQNGETITSDSYYLNYLRDETINNVEYSVYERILPKEFTVYPGNVTITTNVLSIDNTDVLNPVMLQIVTTQTSNLLVQNSAYIGDETVVEPTKTALIEGQLAQDRYEILDLKDRMTDAETQIDLNTENIATNTEDIAKIKLSVNISETYIGQMTGSSLPTTTQLNNYVELAVDRTPNNGDVIIFILTKPDETDKNYKYIYSLATGWNYYELLPMEPAYNGSLGLVKGSYNVGVTRNVLIDLNAGEFTNIYVKNVTTNNYLTLDIFLNNLYNEQQGIKNGTIAVGLATKAVNDGNGDNIAQTYMTNNAGATKEYVQNYALPKEFFQLYYIDSNGYVNEPPTEPSNGVQFTKQVNAVGEFNIFNISRVNASSINLTNKNSAETSIYISADQDTTFQLKLTTYAQKQGESVQNLSIELSNEITITAGDVYKVDFQTNFNELTGVLNLSNGDILGQSLSVITQSSQTTTYSIISNDVYPSSQIMNTQSLVVIGQQGNLGEIPVYDLNGTISGTNISFDFDNNKVYGNTLARFILKVSQQTALPLNYTLNLIYNSQNVRIATPYNYLTGNATIENLQQTNITFDAVNGTIIDFIGFINIDEGDNITIYVNEDDLSDFKSQITNLQTNKQDKFQFSTMPTASASNSGQIVQYVGTTDANYTNGYLYKSDGSVWSRIDVQPNSGGSGGSSSGGVGGLSQTLLWENSNTSIEFSAQNITLNDSVYNYDYIVIDYIILQNSYGNSGILNTFIKVEENQNNDIAAQLIYIDDVKNAYVRKFEITDSNIIEVGNCTNNNNWSIPYKIYGVKVGSSSSNLNIYSLEETVIGTYLDKPLYRKLVPIPQSFTISVRSVGNISVSQADLPANVSRYINGFCVTHDTGRFNVFGGVLVQSVNYQNAVISLYNSSITDSLLTDPNTTYAVLEYTKTTDL